MKQLAGKIRRKLLWNARDFLGLPMPDPAKCAGEVRILCFHGICPDEVPYINGRFLHVSDFRALLIYLKENTHVLTPDEWKAKSFRSDRLNVLLTFDDGYLNNLEIALPVLKELNLPVLWFVTGQQDYLQMDLFDLAVDAGIDLHELGTLLGASSANHAELKSRLVRIQAAQLESAMQLLIQLTEPLRARYEVFWKLLSDSDLVSLKNHPLITLGNHTYAHLFLTLQTEPIIEQEVRRVDERFRKLDIPLTDYLATPYGILDESLLLTLQKQKKWCIFVNEVRPELKKASFERLIINPFISLRNQAHAIYNGYY